MGDMDVRNRGSACLSSRTIAEITTEWATTPRSAGGDAALIVSVGDALNSTAASQKAARSALEAPLKFIAGGQKAMTSFPQLLAGIVDAVARDDSDGEGIDQGLVDEPFLHAFEAVLRGLSKQRRSELAKHVTPHQTVVRCLTKTLRRVESNRGAASLPMLELHVAATLADAFNVRPSDLELDGIGNRVASVLVDLLSSVDFAPHAVAAAADAFSWADRVGVALQPHSDLFSRCIETKAVQMLASSTISAAWFTADVASTRIFCVICVVAAALLESNAVTPSTCFSVLRSKVITASKVTDAERACHQLIDQCFEWCLSDKTVPRATAFFRFATSDQLDETVTRRAAVLLGKKNRIPVPIVSLAGWIDVVLTTARGVTDKAAIASVCVALIDTHDHLWSLCDAAAAAIAGKLPPQSTTSSQERQLEEAVDSAVTLLLHLDHRGRCQLAAAIGRHFASRHLVVGARGLTLIASHPNTPELIIAGLFQGASDALNRQLTLSDESEDVTSIVDSLAALSALQLDCKESCNPCEKPLLQCVAAAIRHCCADIRTAAAIGRFVVDSLLTDNSNPAATNLGQLIAEFSPLSAATLADATARLRAALLELEDSRHARRLVYILQKLIPSGAASLVKVVRATVEDLLASCLLAHNSSVTVDDARLAVDALVTLGQRYAAVASFVAATCDAEVSGVASGEFCSFLRNGQLHVVEELFDGPAVGQVAIEAVLPCALLDLCLAPINLAKAEHLITVVRCLARNVARADAIACSTAARVLHAFEELELDDFYRRVEILHDMLNRVTAAFTSGCGDDADSCAELCWPSRLRDAACERLEVPAVNACALVEDLRTLAVFKDRAPTLVSALIKVHSATLFSPAFKSPLEHALADLTSIRGSLDGRSTEYLLVPHAIAIVASATLHRGGEDANSKLQQIAVLLRCVCGADDFVLWFSQFVAQYFVGEALSLTNERLERVHNFAVAVAPSVGASQVGLLHQMVRDVRESLQINDTFAQQQEAGGCAPSFRGLVLRQALWSATVRVDEAALPAGMRADLHRFMACHHQAKWAHNCHSVLKWSSSSSTALLRATLSRGVVELKCSLLQALVLVAVDDTHFAGDGGATIAQLALKLSCSVDVVQRTVDSLSRIAAPLLALTSAGIVVVDDGLSRLGTSKKIRIAPPALAPLEGPGRGPVAQIALEHHELIQSAIVRIVKFHQQLSITRLLDEVHVVTEKRGCRTSLSALKNHVQKLAERGFVNFHDDEAVVEYVS